MAASNTDDESKGESFKIHSIEFKLFKKFNKECNGADMMLKAMYDSLSADEVPQALLDMYYEAGYGTDRNVRRRMRNRIYYIGKKIR